MYEVEGRLVLNEKEKLVSVSPVCLKLRNSTPAGSIVAVGVLQGTGVGVKVAVAVVVVVVVGTVLVAVQSGSAGQGVLVGPVGVFVAVGVAVLVGVLVETAKSVTPPDDVHVVVDGAMVGIAVGGPSMPPGL